MFAIDKSYRGQVFEVSEDGTKIYWSDIMLNSCISLAEMLREEYVGFICITLYSTKEGERLYRRNGFEAIEEDMSICEVSHD